MNCGSGAETLQFKASGAAIVEELDDKQEKAVNGINIILEYFFGINYSELATRIWELFDGMGSSVELVLVELARYHPTVT